MFPTNGSGLGHMTRCLAYARHIPDGTDCSFFSLASAGESIEDFGFAVEYFISPFWSQNSTYDWNCELAVRFGMMLERVQPQVVVFDGTWPFQGFLAACKAYSRPLKLVWSNRGLLKEDSKQVSTDTTIFDLIIRPGELGSAVHEEMLPISVPRLTVPPVTLFGDAELLPRAEARRELGLPQEGRLALISLGPGNLKDVSGVGHRLIRLLQAEGFGCVWACAPISVRDVELPPSVRPLSVYPLVRCLRAFDVFVGAAGYNTCCEVAQTQVPSLIVPNALLADHQAARARLLAQHAPVVVSPCETDAEAAQAVGELLELARAHKPRACPVPMNGAELAAQAILRLAQE
jgi:UDP:flavonoid glycosyltransferase YjiC (YdhE family)